MKRHGKTCDSKQVLFQNISHLNDHDASVLSLVSSYHRPVTVQKYGTWKTGQCEQCSSKVQMFRYNVGQSEIGFRRREEGKKKQNARDTFGKGKVGQKKGDAKTSDVERERERQA